jgi:succinate dehydrogenase / fumarate reductase cytochrome b subunit
MGPPVKKRPVFLDLRLLHFPVGAVLSILHRVTGVMLVCAIPLSIYFLQLLNSGADGFREAMSMLDTLSGKVVLSLITWLLIQHTLSGIRHLAMDMDYGYDRQTARRTAWLAFGSSLVLIIASGWLIWR